MRLSMSRRCATGRVRAAQDVAQPSSAAQDKVMYFLILWIPSAATRDLARRNPAGLGQTCQLTIKPGITRLGSSRQDMHLFTVTSARPGAGLARLGVAWRSAAGPGRAWRGMAQRGTAFQGKVCTYFNRGTAEQVVDLAEHYRSRQVLASLDAAKLDRSQHGAAIQGMVMHLNSSALGWFGQGQANLCVAALL